MMLRSAPNAQDLPTKHAKALLSIFRGLGDYLQSGGKLSNAKRIGRESLFFIYEAGNSSKYTRHPISNSAACLRGNKGKAYDHAIPLDVWLTNVLLGDLTDLSDFQDALKRWYHIRIVTSQEHGRLNALGLGNCMPSDWDGSDVEASYKKAGIEFGTVAPISSNRTAIDCTE